MKIQSINQQNIYNKTNPNFKALKYSKKTLKQVALTPKMLKENKELQKLSQIFDMTIKKGTSAPWIRDIDKYHLEKRSYYGKKSVAAFLASIGVTIAAGTLCANGLTAILISMGFTIPVTLYPFLKWLNYEQDTHVPIASHYKEPMLNINLSKDGKSSIERSFTELDLGRSNHTKTEFVEINRFADLIEQNHRDTICKRFIDKSEDEYLAEILERVDEDGNTFAHICSDKNLEALYNRLLNNHQNELLTKVLTTKNNEGEIPVHNLSDKTIFSTLDNTLQMDKENKKELYLAKSPKTNKSLADRLVSYKYDLTSFSLYHIIGEEETKKLKQDYIENITLDELKKFNSSFKLEEDEFLHDVMMRKDSQGKRIIQRFLDEDFIFTHKNLENLVGKENAKIINEEIISTKCEEVYADCQRDFLSKLSKNSPLHQGEILKKNSVVGYILSLSPNRLKEMHQWRNYRGLLPIQEMFASEDFVRSTIELFKDDNETLKKLLSSEVWAEEENMTVARYHLRTNLSDEMYRIFGDDIKQDKEINDLIKENAFHYVRDPEKLKEMIKLFNSQPQYNLADALLKKNLGYTAIYKMTHDKNLIYVLIEEFKENLELLKKILLTPVFDEKGYIKKPSIMGDEKYREDKEFISIIKKNLGEKTYNNLKKIEQDNWNKYLDTLKHHEINISRSELKTNMENVAKRNPRDLVEVLNATHMGTTLACDYYKYNMLPALSLNDILKDEPELLSEIYFAKNGELLKLLVGKNDLSLLNSLANIISKDEEISARMYAIVKDAATSQEKYQIINELDKYFASLSENIDQTILETNLYNPKELLKLLKSPIVLNLGGEVINRKVKNGDSILFHIADVKPTKENAQILTELALILKSSDGIDYSQKDGLGFNFLEKVLYMENEYLLNAIANKKWEYTQEMDSIFADIKNEKIKEMAKEIKIEFSDLKKAVELKSIKSLEILEKQLKSPFYNREIQGAELWEIAKRHDRKFRTALCLQFKDYLPQKAQQELLEEA